MTNLIPKLSKKIQVIWLSGIVLAQYDKGIESQTFKDLKSYFGSGLPGSDTFGGLVALIVQILLVVAGSIAVIFLIIGGYRYITASGNEEQTEAAKKTLTGALIGLVIIAMSFAIIAIISNILLGQTGTRPGK